MSAQGMDEAGSGDRQPGRKNLVGKVSGELRQAILAGDFSPGEKLPSEAGLTQRFDVSRTVIREAIASLRADGLVEARHGVGVFVLTNQPPASQAVGASGLQPIDASRISSMIEMLELRAAVEIEAAGLAAARRSPAQMEAIFERFDDLGLLIAEGKPTTAADFAFHLAIANATNNPRFREFFEMMGRAVIPRSALQEGRVENTAAGYLEQIQAEHKLLAEAILARDEEAARDAVRTHLKGSLKRYRDLIRHG
ncbi:MAG TPA: FadR/GntR family transcriptional regulator [Terriglobales bacterium]|nr:FadR/GntR family transcriptional regulator [Terriglobales bacterium]